VRNTAALLGAFLPVRPRPATSRAAPANLYVTRDQRRLYNIFELRTLG
jgi:hypothetical protein